MFVEFLSWFSSDVDCMDQPYGDAAGPACVAVMVFGLMPCSVV